MFISFLFELCVLQFAEQTEKKIKLSSFCGSDVVLSAVFTGSNYVFNRLTTCVITLLICFSRIMVDCS